MLQKFLTYIDNLDSGVTVGNLTFQARPSSLQTKIIEEIIFWEND